MKSGLFIKVCCLIFWVFVSFDLCAQSKDDPYTALEEFAERARKYREARNKMTESFSREMNRKYEKELGENIYSLLIDKHKIFFPNKKTCEDSRDEFARRCVNIWKQCFGGGGFTIEDIKKDCQCIPQKNSNYKPQTTPSNASTSVQNDFNIDNFVSSSLGENKTQITGSVFDAPSGRDSKIPESAVKSGAPELDLGNLGDYLDKEVHGVDNIYKNNYEYTPYTANSTHTATPYVHVPKSGYQIMKELAAGSGLNFDNYFTAAEWDLDFSEASREEIFEWSRKYNQFINDAFGSDPAFKISKEFQEKVKEELIDKGIDMAVLLVSTSVDVGATLVLTPAGAMLLRPVKEGVLQSAASIAHGINQNKSTDEILKDSKKAFADGTVEGVVGNVQEGKFLPFYIGGKAFSEGESIPKVLLKSIGTAVTNNIDNGYGLPAVIIIENINNH